jgi:hypothetical protein
MVSKIKWASLQNVSATIVKNLPSILKKMNANKLLMILVVMANMFFCSVIGYELGKRMMRHEWTRSLCL